MVNLSDQYKLQRPHEDSSMDKASPSLNSRNEHFALLSALVIIKEESGLRCVASRRKSFDAMMEPWRWLWL